MVNEGGMRRCLIKGREGDTLMARGTEGGMVFTGNIDRYAILPIEELPADLVYSIWPSTRPEKAKGSNDG
jgi:hypothetical protein